MCRQYIGHYGSNRSQLTTQGQHILFIKQDWIKIIKPQIIQAEEDFFFSNYNKSV